MNTEKTIYLVRRLIAHGSVLAVLAICLLARPAWSQMTLLNTTACGPDAFPAATCTIPATAAGNLVVVGWISEAGGGSATIASVSDNASGGSNPYNRVTNARSTDSVANTMAEIWFAPNVRAGATVLRVTPNPAGTRGTAMIWQFTGADATAPLGQVSRLNNQASSATPAGAAVTTQTGREVVISILNIPSVATGIASGNLFTAPSIVNGRGWAHLLTASSGTYSARWSTTVARTYSSSTVSFKSAAVGTALNACDLTQDGALNNNDVTAATNMVLGTRACTANVLGAGVCNAGMVQRVVNAAVLGETCVTVSPGPGPDPTPRSVSLSWTASTSSGVTGYRIHRATAAGGPYTVLNSSLVTGTTYRDTGVVAGTTYYYVVTAVNSANLSSSYSNEARAAVTSQ